MVMSNGVIVKRTVELDHDVDADDLAAAQRLMSEATSGRSLKVLGEWAQPVEHPGAALATVAAGALREAANAESHQMFVDGRSHIAGSFDARETIEAVLGILEQQFVVVSLLKELVDNGLAVSDRLRERRRDPRGLLARRGALRRRRRARRRDRRARPDPHELSRDALGRGRGEPAAESTAERGLT